MALTLYAMPAEATETDWRLLRTTASVDYGKMDELVRPGRSVLSSSLRTVAETGAWNVGLSLSHLVVRDKLTAPGGQTQRRTLSGVGDTLLSLGYRRGDARYSLGGDFYVKLPTAKSNLGTGEVDAILQVNGALDLDGIVAFTTIGGRVPGRAEGYALKNSAYILAGAQKSWGEWTLGGYGLARTATSRPVGSQVALVPYGSVRLSRRWQMATYASIGMGRTKGDFGAGAQVVFKYD